MAIRQCTNPTEKDIVLDLFAGSGTTGHATFVANLEDSGDRRFILVQLPEPTELVDFATIAELTKERLRRAGSKLREDNPLFSGDYGFRVFKLDSSNINAWDPESSALDDTLLRSIDHIKPDRDNDDILYELLLKLGLNLCVPIEHNTIAKIVVHSIGAGALLVCLAARISREDVERLALGIVDWHKQLNPAVESTIVFRDSAFADEITRYLLR